MEATVFLCVSQIYHFNIFSVYDIPFLFTAFIVRELEVRCFKLRVYDSPVPEALLSMNIDIDSLLDVYAG